MKPLYSCREKLILRIEVLFQQIFSDIELGVPSELIFVRKRTWDVVDSDSERSVIMAVKNVWLTQSTSQYDK